MSAVVKSEHFRGPGIPASWEGRVTKPIQTNDKRNGRIDVPSVTFFSKGARIEINPETAFPVYHDPHWGGAALDPEKLHEDLPSLGFPGPQQIAQVAAITS